MNNVEKQKNQENSETLKLKEGFTRTLSMFSSDTEKIEAIFKKLVILYSQEGRYYHTLKHIQAMLSFLEERKDRIANFKALSLATWYHDAVYDSRSKTNELDSAEMMKQDLVDLSIPEELTQLIYQLILATQKHRTIENSKDCDIFLDADLSILSRTEHVYSAYASNIKKEYSWVPEDEYKKGRKAILENFLQRDKIYFSENMKEAEVVARQNIKRELSQLI